MKLFLLFLLYLAANIGYDYMMNLFAGMTYAEALRSLFTYFARLPLDEFLIVGLSAIFFLGSTFAPSLMKIFAGLVSSKPQQAAAAGKPSGTEKRHKD